MFFHLRPLGPVAVLCMVGATSGCEIPDRSPTLADTGTSVEDGGASRGDAAGDRSIGDVSTDASRGADGGGDVGIGGSGGNSGKGGSGGGGAGGASGGTTGGSGGSGAGGGSGASGAGGGTGGSGGAGTGGSGTTGGSGGSGGTGGAPDASMDRGTGGGPIVDASADKGPTCGSTQKLCGTACVSTTDPGYGCGGTSCAPCAYSNAASACSPSGQCAMGACRAGFADCNTDSKDGCETDLSKAETCGSCTTKCDASVPLCSSSGGIYQCVTGCTAPASSRCGSQCVDVQTNVDHCGICDAKCTPPSAHGSVACRAAQCTTTCDVNYAVCGTECVDTNTDLAHCGGCNQSCNKACVLGLCCTAGQSNCSGVCSDTNTDLANCGGCGRTCSGTCTNGTCCTANQTYCSGACVDTQTNTAHCGGCGNSCAGTCTSGACCTATTACSPTSPCFNLDTDANNCGACGHSCLGGSCLGGACQPVTISGTSPSANLYSFAIDEQNVYWLEYISSSVIKTCPKSGCTGPARTFASFADLGVNMHYDPAAKMLLIAHGSGLFVDAYDMSGNRLFQVDAPSGMAWDVTADANFIYFGEGTSIVRATKDGMNRTVIAAGLPLLVQALGVDTSANMIYAALNGDASLVRTPTTGSAQDAWTNFGPGIQRNATDLMVANGSVYWANSGTAPSRTDGGVYMCSTGSCSQATTLITGMSGDTIAADASSVYFGAGGGIYQCAATGCGAGAVRVTPANPIINFGGSTLKMDATTVYWGALFGPVSKLAR